MTIAWKPVIKIAASLALDLILFSSLFALWLGAPVSSNMYTSPSTQRQISKDLFFFNKKIWIDFKPILTWCLTAKSITYVILVEIRGLHPPLSLWSVAGPLLCSLKYSTSITARNTLTPPPTQQKYPLHSPSSHHPTSVFSSSVPSPIAPSLSSLAPQTL